MVPEIRCTTDGRTDGRTDEQMEKVTEVGAPPKKDSATAGHFKMDNTKLQYKRITVPVILYYNTFTS